MNAKESETATLPGATWSALDKIMISPLVSKVKRAYLSELCPRSGIIQLHGPHPHAAKPRRCGRNFHVTKMGHRHYPDAVRATFRLVLEFSKDLSVSDSCFDPWINFPASTIKRTVFLFSSSILHCNNEDSSSILRRNNEDCSSSWDLGVLCMLLSSIGWPPMRNYQMHKRPTPTTGTAEVCVKGLLQCSTPSSDRMLDSVCNHGIALRKGWSGATLGLGARDLTPVVGRGTRPHAAALGH